MSGPLDWALVGVRFATYGLAILLFGRAVFGALILEAPAEPRAAPVTALALAAAAVAYVALLAREAGGEPGWPRLSDVLGIIVATGFGRALTAVVGFALAAPWFAGCWPRLALSGAALASLAFVGHAADGEGARGAVRLAVMAGHLLAVGAWLGALAPLLAALTGNPAEAYAMLRRTGVVALLAVFVVLGTGLCTLAFVAVDAHGALRPRYLATLGVKLALVAALLAVAAVNRWWLTPMAATGPARALRWLRLTLTIEQLLGAGAVAAVAVLGQLDPAM